jgi:hypothetical protein
MKDRAARVDLNHRDQACEVLIQHLPLARGNGRA